MKVRVWDIDGGKMSSGVDIDLFMQNKEELRFPDTDESLPFKDFLYFRKEHSDWMLFCGMLDIHGAEVYDGDIIKYQHSKDSTEYTGEIYFNSQSGCFYIKTSDVSGFALLGHQKVIEIIGNRYENKNK
jgi:hypothetical protein